MGFALLLYPFAETWAWWNFIERFGWGDAFLWCFSSAIVGILILRLQGQAAFIDLQRSAQTGQAPSKKILHHVLMGVGAILLILPGLWSDLLGALFILPGSRHLLVWYISTKAQGAFTNRMAGFQSSGPFGSFVFTQTIFRNSQDPSSVREARDVRDANVIDVKATVIDEKPVLPRNSENE